MRNVRFGAKAGVDGTFHVTSRVVDKDYKFGPEDKDSIVERLRQYGEFCGVEVLTHSIMCNHFHLTVRIPAAPGPELDDAEIVRLAAVGKISYGAKRLERELAQARKDGDEEAIKRLRNKVLSRRLNLAKFMQAFKQAITQDYNRRHGREGTLWEGRYRSVQLENTERVVPLVSAYVDLNPVRAGMVDDPGDYQWSGYGAAMRGGALALEGIKKIVMECLDSPRLGETPEQEMRRALERYRMYLFEKGEAREASEDGTGGRLGIDPERVEEVLRKGGKLSAFEASRCRNLYFTEGLAVGSEDFVEEVFERYRGQFGARRTKGALQPVGVDLPGIAVLGPVRKQAITVPEAFSRKK
jgi:REP element-mobilizing transposase RayT/general stress protein YciG